MDTKKALKMACLLGGGLYLLTVLYVAFFSEEPEAATITTGYSFSSGETNITHTKLNQAVNSATISGITTADINDSAVTGPKIAASTIAGSKIQTNTVTGGATGNLVLNTVADTNMVVNTLTPVSVTTNYVALPNSAYRYTNSGVTLTFNNDQIASTAVAGTNSSPGAAASGLIPKLNAAHGKLDPTLYYAPSTNATTMAANDQGEVTYQTLASVTTTATNGAVFVIGKAVYDDAGTGSGVIGIRIIDNTGAMLDGSATEVSAADIGTATLTSFAVDRLAGAAKTYSLQGIIQGTPEANAQFLMTGAANADADVLVTNGTKIAVISIPTP